MKSGLLLLRMPVLLAAMVSGMLTLAIGSAWAAFPGENGKIAFASSRDGNDEIYVMDSDGQKQTRLTINQSSDSQPAFSPDGTKIAFTSFRDGNSEVYVMDAVDTDNDGNGDNPTNLTDNGARDFEPAFSPDGTRIAFTSDRDGNFEVYVMDSGGANQTRLTNNPASDAESAFSPDGSEIAFESERDGNLEVYVMDSNGQNPTNLSNSQAFDGDPDWQPLPPSSEPECTIEGTEGNDRLRTLP